MLLKIEDVNPGVQGPPTEAVPQQMRCDPLSQSHIARPYLLKPCFLGNRVQQPLDLPSGDMAHISVLKDISFLPTIYSAAPKD